VVTTAERIFGDARWWAGGIFLFLLAVILSPFIEQQRWPFAHWFASSLELPIGPTPSLPPDVVSRLPKSVEAPKDFPSSLKLLVAPTGQPKELEATNIQWEAFPVEQSYYYKRPFIPQGANPFLYGNLDCKADADGFCKSESKSLTLLLKFEKPTIYKKLNVTMAGSTRSAEIMEMTPAYAVVYFSSYPAGQIVDIRTEN
jgi:hypothetical protein